MITSNVRSLVGLRMFSIRPRRIFKVPPMGLMAAAVAVWGCSEPRRFTGIEGNPDLGVGGGNGGVGGHGDLGGIGGTATFPADAGTSQVSPTASGGFGGEGTQAVGGEGMLSAGGRSGQGGAADAGGAVGTGGTATGGTAGIGIGGVMGRGGIPATGGNGLGGVSSAGTSGGAGTGGVPACTCSTNQTCCGTTCIDTQTSSESCGTCGHGCLGGTCVAGQCQPVMLGRYDRYFGQNGLSVGDNHIYAKGEANLIVRAKKDGSDLTMGPLPTLGTSGCTGGGAVEIGGRLFYQWNDGTTCRMAYCSPDDCDGTTQGFSPSAGASWVQSFAADRATSQVFWFDGASKHFMVASTLGAPSGMTVPSADISTQATWTGYASGGILFLDDNAMEHLPSSGGNLASLANRDGLDIRSLCATSARLYWSTANAIHFVNLPTASGGDQVLVSSPAVTIWADDTDLFWTGDGKTLERCKVNNCTATKATIGAASTCSIVAIGGEAAAVYWTAQGGCPDKGQIWKIAR